MLRLDGSQKHRIELTVNGKQHSGEAPPRLLLCDFLRHELGLYGTHVGCEHGVCGACTILMNGRAVRSCTQYAVQADGQEIQTVEGLNNGDTLTDLQDAFRQRHALQCGFCTPGILMSVTHFLNCTTNPSETDIRDMLSGHICRCTGYDSIVKAILDVAETRAIEEKNQQDK